MAVVTPTDLYQTCADVGAQVIVPKNSIENAAYRNVNPGLIILIGITDVEEEGVWKNVNNGSPVSWTHFATNEGNRIEPAVFMRSDGWWLDAAGGTGSTLCEKQPFNRCE